jgi:hypothetical protein
MKVEMAALQCLGSYPVVTKDELSILHRYYDPDNAIERRDIGGIWQRRFDFVALLALRDFFQPETILVNGWVVLRSPAYSAYEEARVIAHTSRRSNETSDPVIENLAAWNWVELYYEFGSVDPTITDFENFEEELDDMIAKTVRDSWDAWLHYKYPGRKFDVRTIPPEETGGCWGVGFYESR